MRGYADFFTNSIQEKMSIVFIYKKENQVQFHNMEDALERGLDLKKEGWSYVSTVEASILLTNIYDICVDDTPNGNRVNEIIDLIISA